VLVDDRAVNGALLVEGNAVRRPPQQLIGKLRRGLFSTAEMFAIRLEFLVGAPRFELGTPVPRLTPLTDLNRLGRIKA
jgi:hypothetical protein